jgi:hypothetical protein
MDPITKRLLLRATASVLVLWFAAARLDAQNPRPSEAESAIPRPGPPVPLLFTDTAAADPPSDSAQALVDWNPGSFRLAAAEILFANVLNWAINEYALDYKDIARISPKTWRLNAEAGPQWDDNHFAVNMFMHPYGGNIYHMAGRANGYNFEKSFLFAFMGSVLWECCGESHRGSLNDLFTTTLGGAAMGEIAYRLAQKMMWNDTCILSLLAVLTAPSLRVTDWILGRDWPVGQDGYPWELPQSLSVTISAGGQRFGNGTDGYGGILELGSTYDTFTGAEMGARPFTHFETALELNTGVKPLLSRIQARGILWPLFASTGGSGSIPSSAHLLPFLGLDYVNRLSQEGATRVGHQFGGASLGLAPAFSWGSPTATNFALTADGHVLFGGIDSEFARLGEILHGKEREREYDMGVAPGFGAAAILGLWTKLRVSGFYRWNRFFVMHGSNADGWKTEHDAWHYGVVLTASKLVGRLGIGFDAKFYGAESRYGNPDLQLTQTLRQPDDRLRLYLTWDAESRPRGMFVF